MREQIWSTLVNLRFKGFYIGFLIDKFQKRDRNLNIFLAVASSGSIAAWAIWNLYPFIWGGIIALSQVITVVKPYFPYFKYVKELTEKSARIDILNIDMERLWYKIQNDKITEDESVEVYFDLRKQIVEILNFRDDTVFSGSKIIEKKANERVQTFLKNNYNISININ